MRQLAILCVGALAALAAPSAAQADAVIDWNLHAQSTILAPGPTSHASTLDFAMVHGAVYDAVNRDRPPPSAVSGRSPRRPHGVQGRGGGHGGLRVLVARYPDRLSTLQGHYDASLLAIPDGRAKLRGIAAGEDAAAAMLAARANDGRLPPGTPYPFPQGTAPGEWRVSPPLTTVDPAWWVGNVRPFLIPNARWFLSDGPPALTSRAYAKDFKEVKRLGEFDSPAPDRRSDDGRDLLAGQPDACSTAGSCASCPRATG